MSNPAQGAVGAETKFKIGDRVQIVGEPNDDNEPGQITGEQDGRFEVTWRCENGRTYGEGMYSWRPHELRLLPAVDAALASPRADSDERTAGEPQGAWMQTFCLPHFRVLDPDPSQILIEDIAHHLSQNVRYGGAGIRFLSVAEHSVHMARAARPEHALWALLHDASETYLHDLVRPVKRSLAGYAQAEDRIMRAVCERFGLPHEMPREVKRLDNRILIDETRQNMRPSDVTWSFGGETEPLGVTLQYWTPEQAEREFLATYTAITGLPVTMLAAPIRPDAREAIARIIAPAMWARFDRYGGLGDADVPEGNNISWMVSDSLSTADAILAALPTPSATPAQPAGAVPDSLREVLQPFADASEVMTAPDCACVVFREYNSGKSFLEPLQVGHFRAARDALSLLASHPAGQSAGSGAETDQQSAWARAAETVGDDKPWWWDKPWAELGHGSRGDVQAWFQNRDPLRRVVEPDGPDRYVRLYRDPRPHMLAPAPDSTRTGQGEADKLVRLLAAVSDRLRDNPPNGLVEGDLYVAAKNEEPDSGWRYVPTGLTVGDLDQARVMIAARPAAPEAQGLAKVIAAKCKEVDAVLGPDPWKTRKHVGGIYIASKTAHAPRWRQMRADGLPIISTWIDEAGKGDTACFTDLWRRCVDEAASADAVIVYRQPDEVLKGAFVEVGAALAVGTPVYAIGCDEFSFVHHAGVTRCQSLAQALADITGRRVEMEPII